MNENRDHRDNGLSEEMMEFSNSSENSADAEETAKMRDERRLRWNSERADALRAKLYEFFSQQEEKGMYISFKEADPDDSLSGDSDDSETRIPIAVELPEEFHTILYPANMKEGYRLSEVDIVGDQIIFTFWDERKEKYILFEYMDLDTAVQVDTEFSENSKAEVNGQEALLQKTESGDLVLYWPKDDYLLVLDGGKSLHTKKELVQMAESVRWYDRKVFVQD